MAVELEYLLFVIFFVFFILIFIVTGTVAMKVDIKRFGNGENERFYHGYSSKRKIINKKSKIDSLFEILIIVYVAFVLFLFGYLFGSIEEFREHWNGMGIRVDALAEIMFNMWIALMGVLVVLVSFMKKTWLTFSADDIIKRFGVKRDMVRMGAYALMEGAIHFFKPIMLSHLKYEWYFGVRFLALSAFVAFMWHFFKLCYLLIESFFGNKMEQIFLDSLHEELWYNPVRKMKQEDKWEDVDTIKIYTNYLLDSYLLFSKKIEIEKIHKIGFTTNLYYIGEDEYKKQRYAIVRERSICYLRGILGLLLLVPIAFVGMTEVIKNGMPVLQCVLGGGAFIAIVLIMVSIYAAKSESFAMFMIILTNGRDSYELVYKEDSNRKLQRRFVREVAFFKKSNYWQYIHAMKCLIAFFLIAPDVAKDIIINELKQQCLERNKDLEIHLVLVVLDYLDYINGQEKYLLPNFLQKGEWELLKRLARAFCLDIGRQCFDCPEKDGLAKFEDYVKNRKNIEVGSFSNE